MASPGMRVGVVLMLAAALTAAEARPTRAGVLADALAVLKVNDPRLLDREVTQFAAGLGINPEPLRARLANLLFRSRNLDGIDLARPALMAWRPQEPALVAVIPLADRRAFLNSFGAGLAGDAPLIRVGERDGTVVYTQNGNDGLVEYRLLVSDRAAYLAGTTAQCRELAEFPLQPATGEAPLTFTASAGFLARAGTAAPLANDYQRAVAAVSPGLANVQGALRAGWNAFVDQLAAAELSVRPDAHGTLVFSLVLRAKPDSTFAVWIANQRNQPSRLLPLVRSEQSVFTMAGNIVWQGQAERLGKVFAPVLRESFGDRWTAMVEENWSAMWALADRAGPFALASDVDLKEGKPVGETRFLGDQPKAQDLMSLITLVTQTLTGTVGEAVTAGNAAGYREQLPGGDQVLVSNERFLYHVQSTVRPAPEVAADLVTRSQTIGAPEGLPGVVHLGLNLTPLVRTLVVALGGDLAPGLPTAACAMTIKTGLPGQLVVDGTFPAPAVAQLLRDSGIMQFGEQPATTPPRR